MSTMTIDDISAADSSERHSSVRTRNGVESRRRLAVAGALGAVVAICAAGATAIWYIHLTTPATLIPSVDARAGVRLSNGSRIPLTTNGSAETNGTQSHRQIDQADVRGSASTTPNVHRESLTDSAPPPRSTDEKISGAPTATARQSAFIQPSSNIPSVPTTAQSPSGNATVAASPVATTISVSSDDLSIDPLQALIDASARRNASAPPPSGSLSWSPRDRVRPAATGSAR